MAETDGEREGDYEQLHEHWQEPKGEYIHNGPFLLITCSNKTVSKLKSFYLQAFWTVRPLTNNNNNDNEKQGTIAVHPAGR